jgi:hypothetical protein
LVGAALSVVLFSGCQKEGLSTPIQDTLQGQNDSKIELKYKAPSVSEAQSWFEQSFGKTHTIATKVGDTTQTSVLNVRSGSPQIDVTPVWNNAQISAYLSNRQVLMVPVNPIEALKKPRVGYCAVFFRDSLGKIGYTLQVTAAKANYLATHQNLSVNDFSGVFLQIRPDGQVKNMLGIEEGKIMGPFKVPKGNNLDGEEGCFSWYQMWAAILADLGGGSGGFTTHDPFSGINYGDIGDSYGPAGGSNGSPISYPPIILNTEIDNTLFDMDGQMTIQNYYQDIYVVQNNFVDTEFEIMYNDKILFTLINKFLTDSGWDENAKQLIKDIISLSNAPGPQDPKFLVGAVAATGKLNNNKNGRCVEYQQKLKEYLDANKTKYKISSIQYFEIKGATSYIDHLDYKNGTVHISTNGIHRFTLVDGYIFDNHHPKGVLKSDWDKGLIIISPFTILPVVP